MERRVEDYAQIKKYIKSAYGLKVLGCKKITHGVMNTNFVVRVANKKKFIYKIYEYKSATEVNEELAVLQILAKNNFLCPLALKTVSGKYLSNFFGKPALLYSYIEGKAPNFLDNKTISQTGTIMASMHVLLKKVRLKHRNATWDLENLKNLLKKTKGFENSRYPEAVKLVIWAKENLSKFNFPATLPKGFTHEDIKPENIIVAKGKVAGVVDFDNSYIGNLLSDVSTTIIWACFKRGEFDFDLYKAFVSKYNAIRPFTSLEKKYFYDYIKFRLVREVFIGPYVTQNKHILSKKRSDCFKNILNKFDSADNKAAIELILKNI